MAYADELWPEDGRMTPETLAIVRQHNAEVRARGGAPAIPGQPPASSTVPTNAFQAQQAPLVQQDFQAIINNALAQQAGVYGDQNALVASLQAQAAGTGGPNLAQQQLQNATNQNIQSQAGATASIRGLSPALAQRLIAQQGANIQQQAAGQSAEQAMMLQLAAQQQLAGVLGQQQAGNLNQFGTGAQAFGTQNALGLQNFQNAQGLNADVAAQNANLQAGAQGLAANVTQANNARSDRWAGAALNAAGPLLDKATSGGPTGGAPGYTPSGDPQNPSFVGPPSPYPTPSTPGAAHGGRVPGRARYPGDDRRNDTEPFMLAPGELVVPASIADDPEAVAAFTSAIARHRKQNQKAA